MKLRIGDTEYDYQRALQKIGLAHLLELQTESGVGRRTIMDGLSALDEALTRREGESDEAYLERGLDADQDPRILKALPGLIFVCKRHAGEDITVAAAGQFGWDSFRFVPEESDVEADPTEGLTAPSQPDSETPNGTGSSVKSVGPKKSKTSKPTSTAA